MPRTITLPVEWTTEEIDDSVWGNGSLAQPWWSDLEPALDGNNDLIVCGLFGIVEDDDTERFSITFDDWLAAAQKVANKYPHYRQYILDKDLDSDLGDLILQYAVAGEAVYG